MRTISVYLNDRTEEALDEIMQKNGCTISDAVSIALLTLAQEGSPIFTPTVTLWQKLKAAVQQATGQQIQDFCHQHGIKLEVLRALCKRLENGSTIRGDGDSNKWRDKQDGRIYKTHTSYAAQVLKKECDIDLEGMSDDL